MQAAASGNPSSRAARGVAARGRQRGPWSAAPPEFGIVAAKGISRLPALLEAVAAEGAVPDAAKGMLAFLGAQVACIVRAVMATGEACRGSKRAATSAAGAAAAA